MADQITITLPDGSTRALPAGTTAGGSGGGHRPAAGQGGGDRRRRRRRARPRLGRWPTATRSRSSPPTATAGSSRSATPPPTCWPRPCSTSSPGPRSASARRSRTASTTTSSCPDGGTFHEDDLERIEARMREIIAESQPFVRDEMPADKAREVFADHRYKLEIIDGASTDPMSATRRRSRCAPTRTRRPPQVAPPFAGYPGFIDLCRGPHVPHTKAHLGHFKLMRVAGAYWRGDERQPAAAAHLRHGLGLEAGARRTTSTGWRRRPSATTASSARSSTCSASPTRSARASPSSTPRAGWCAGSWRTTPASATRRPATSSCTRPTSPRRGCSRRRGTSTGTPTACSPRCTSTTRAATAGRTTTSSR